MPTVLKDQERFCHVCKKRFVLPYCGGEWGWTINDKQFCSYTCMRKFENKRSGNKKRHYAGYTRGGKA